jgi:DNA-binding response OmpR family regulator
MRAEVLLGQSSIRVLVVDDFEAFRRLIADILKSQPELQIVAEASDGAEAVRKADQIQPDLVLLDIGLPKLNGIEAARRILEVSPLSRILFVSQGLSVDALGEGLGLGATGFVAKPDASRELLTGVNAVLRGETFLSRRLFGQGPVGVRGHIASAEGSQQYRKTRYHHAAGFYSDDSHLLEDLTQFAGTALKAGSTAIVIATEAHRERLMLHLQTRDLDMTAAIQQKRYLALDASDALGAFMVDGLPDRTRFFTLMGDLVTETAEGRRTTRIALFGECAHLLWTRGSQEAALQLETFGNQLIVEYDIDILCGYSLGSFQGRAGGDPFAKVCAEHTAYYSR